MAILKDTTRELSVGRAAKTLQAAGLASGLTGEELKELAELGTDATFPKSTAILREDSRSRDLYVIRKGRIVVELLLAAEDAKEEKLHSMGDGDIFGELSLIDGAPRSATVRAETEVTVLKFDYQKLDALMNLHPRIGFHLIRNIARIICMRIRSTNLLWRNSLLW